MAFLANDLIELVPLDPDNEVHVETYRRSRSEPEMRATGTYGACDTPSQARERISEGQNTENPGARCAIRAEETVVGWAATHRYDSRAHAAYIECYVLPDYWKNGYATEATRLLVTYTFDELNAHRIEASVQADNPASGRVLEKLGFQKEGVRRDFFYKEASTRTSGSGACSPMNSKSDRRSLEIRCVSRRFTTERVGRAMATARTLTAAQGDRRAGRTSMNRTQHGDVRTCRI